MNQGLFNYGKRLVNNPKYKQGGKLKITRDKSLAESLHYMYGFGVIRSGHLHFTFDDRLSLIRQVQVETGTDLTRDTFNAPQSRLLVAKNERNEKTHSHAVSRDFILLNTRKNFCFNGQILAKSPLISLGQYIQGDQISSIDHEYIVLVENLAIMAQLDGLKLPECLDKALWLYRGDIKSEQRTGTAYAFFRRFKTSHKLVCFSDLDPAGIVIALTCDADYWLTAKDFNVIDMPLPGVENEWYQQGDSITYLEAQSSAPAICSSALSAMAQYRKTLKQEHLLVHEIALGLFAL